MTAINSIPYSWSYHSREQERTPKDFRERERDKERGETKRKRALQSRKRCTYYAEKTADQSVCVYDLGGRALKEIERASHKGGLVIIISVLR